MDESFIRFENVKKIYRSGEVEVTALHDVSFTVGQGERCVIVGESGAGKTTLLNILGGMDTLSGGRVLIGGEELSAFDKKRLTAFRRTEVGFVFQFYNLIPNLTALENVEIAAKLCKDALAIARALAKNPRLLLCDEPTGALDYRTGKAILKLLQDAARSHGMTVVIITHNKALCAMADRVIRVKSGTVLSVERNDAPTDIEQIEW